ncbi:Ldh family oxidoreductase [Brevibacillus agri]|uniref:Ldh family oxidoreductase n=1 Tax=Brevibacillus agri TaxID=51101 RepID=UPI003D1AD7B7
MNPTRFHWKGLEQVAAQVLSRAGVRGEDAQLVARSLVHADLRGVESHGLSRLPIYVQRIEAGLIELTQPPALVVRQGATALIDGKNQLGVVVGVAALDEAKQLARQHGIGLAGVRHSNHFGSCSYYAEQAVDEGLILLVLSNAPASMAPTGGIVPFFGTNPIAIGIPAGEQPPFLLDMATSVAARGKIALAAKKGSAIPEDWAIDADGLPTHDPTKALLGSLLPIGRAKGYGLAMFIDIVCGLLTGAAVGPGVKSLYDNWQDPQDIGHVFLCIDVQRFLPLDAFRQSMDAYIRQVKNVPTAPGVAEILIPGEIEQRIMTARKQDGIPFPQTVVEELAKLCSAYGIDLAQAVCTA